MQGASIDRIAAEAGYTKGAFYAHFASKEDLFLTCSTSISRPSSRVSTWCSPAPRTPVEEARRAAEDFLEQIDADPEWRRVYQEFATHAARHDAFRAEFAARQRALRERMAAVFARWASDLGVTPPVPPAEIAAMTFFMADGFLLDQIIDPELDPALYGRMFEVFMHGLMAMTEQG